MRLPVLCALACVALLVGTAPARAEHPISVDPEHAFRFEWDPATGSPDGYEVELRIWPYLRAKAEPPPLVIYQTVTTESIELVPAMYATTWLRVRAIRDGAEPGPWSEESTDSVSRIGNPDVNGDGGIGMPEFLVLGRHWAWRIVDGWRLVPPAE